MDNTNLSSKNLWVATLILSLGLIISALVLGYALQQTNGAKNTITVKGLAEKPIKADSARWEIHLKTNYASSSISEAYQQLDLQMKMLQNFFVQQGITANEMKTNNKTSSTYYEDIDLGEGRSTREFRGYLASQSLIISSKSIDKINKAASNAYQLDEKGVRIEQQPEYLVSNLEEIKMSLIANATKNAHSRANEFAKVGGVDVGMMRSASQGAFYILPESGSDEDSDYGGAYDKSTIDKIARVVVTINYAID